MSCVTVNVPKAPEPLACMRRSGMTSRSKWASFSRNQTSCSNCGPRGPAVMHVLVVRTGTPALVVNFLSLLDLCILSPCQSHGSRPRRIVRRRAGCACRQRAFWDLSTIIVEYADNSLPDGRSTNQLLSSPLRMLCRNSGSQFISLAKIPASLAESPPTNLIEVLDRTAARSFWSNWSRFWCAITSPTLYLRA